MFADAENWRDVPGYGGRYQVSDHGRVRSFALSGRAKILTPRPRNSRQPHLRVMLTKKRHEDQQRFYVHRLVAEAFLGPCPEGYVVHHRDGNPLNNAVDNLEYCTHAQNYRHSFDAGNAFFTPPEESEEIARAYRRLGSLRAVARETGVDQSAVRRAVLRQAVADLYKALTDIEEIYRSDRPDADKLAGIGICVNHAKTNVPGHHPLLAMARHSRQPHEG
jgi:hypothetical protein